MKVAHVVGARPHFIKAAMVSRAFRAAGIEEAIIHTGQHYDAGMSSVFFKELELPRPAEHLEVSLVAQGTQTGEMLINLEAAFERIVPDVVLVHGDTNTTLAGALAAAQMGIPLAHNEAGLRSFNKQMPEEHNRVITDHCSQLLFCPSQSAAERLAREGVSSGVHVTGDVMYDAALFFSRRLEPAPSSNAPMGEYVLTTIHRGYNADNQERLSTLLKILSQIPCSIVFPVHPRTASKIASFGLSLPDNVRLLEPVGYLEMLSLERHANAILTDSGGVQKEAYFFGVPCITLRPETEWTETVDTGWNIVTDLDEKAVLIAISSFDRSIPRPDLFGDGTAAEQIAGILKSTFV